MGLIPFSPCLEITVYLIQASLFGQCLRVTMGHVQCFVVIQSCFKCFSMRVQKILLLILQYLIHLLSDFQNVCTKMVLPYQNNSWRPRGPCAKCYSSLVGKTSETSSS